MTKSKGVGRGGIRKGAGRIPKAAKVDWDAVGRAYFTSDKPIEDICRSFGIDYGDLLTHATSAHWVLNRPSTKPSDAQHPADLGGCASALALAMFSNDSVSTRARRFVAAMACLGEHKSDIAAALEISERQLLEEFKKEVAITLPR